MILHYIFIHSHWFLTEIVNSSSKFVIQYQRDPTEQTLIFRVNNRNTLSLAATAVKILYHGFMCSEMSACPKNSYPDVISFDDDTGWSILYWSDPYSIIPGSRTSNFCTGHGRPHGKWSWYNLHKEETKYSWINWLLNWPMNYLFLVKSLFL